MNKHHTNKAKQTQTPAAKKNATQPDPNLKNYQEDNTDQDGHCTTPAYGESVGPNSGAPCDDGRAGGNGEAD